MSKVTSKLQVTIPKAVATRYGISPGDEVVWEPAGESVRMVPGKVRRPMRDVGRRVRLFDAATKRQEARETGAPSEPAEERGWTREDLYDRGLPR